MENYKFSTLEYKRPDLETRRAKLAQWKAAVGQAESYEALRSLIFEIDRESCELFTQYSIAHIRHTLDTRDEFYEAEINYLQDTLPTLSGDEVALSKQSRPAPSGRTSSGNSASNTLSPWTCRRSCSVKPTSRCVSRRAA